MVPSTRVIRSFLTDALRLGKQAAQAVETLQDQDRSGAPLSSAKIKLLFQVVHTLKGTSSMVPGAESVVSALHELEAQLAARPLHESARAPEWLPMAAQSVREAVELLGEMERISKTADSLQSGIDSRLVSRGLLVCSQVGERERRLWFPLGVIAKILSPAELARRQVVCFEGAWVPVVGECRQYGVALRTDAGVMVLGCGRLEAVTSWTEAAHRGGIGGVDYLKSQLELQLPVAA